jgi:hypothetical protein
MQKTLGGQGAVPRIRLPATPPAGAPEATASRVTGQPRRLAATTCGWCGGPLVMKDRGRIPKWCSAACRQRAWEQSRAAASGLAAVQVVERPIEVPVPAVPKRADWPALLHELARQLDDGRIYDRDLDELAAAINAVVDACVRRAAFRGHPGRASGWDDRGRRER